MRGFRVDRICRTRAVVRHGEVVVLSACWVADRWVARLVGLLGTRDLAEGEGLWLERCGSIHTFGMRIPIACAFLDADGRVLEVADPIPPWRSARVRGARSVVETVTGGFAGLRSGDRLERSDGGSAAA